MANIVRAKKTKSGVASLRASCLLAKEAEHITA